MLKAKQKLLAELMVLKPDWNNIDYANEIGINEKTFYRWKKEEEFQDYLHKLCKEKFLSFEKKAIRELENQIKEGNWKAIEYVLNGCGYLAPTKLDIDATLENNININIGDEEDD